MHQSAGVAGRKGSHGYNATWHTSRIAHHGDNRDQEVLSYLYKATKVNQ